MTSINLQFHSFEFSQGVISPNDTIRLSITTLPDEQKQASAFTVNKMHLTTPTFKIKSFNNVQKIIIVFRKKKLGFIENIFASTVLKSEDFSKYYDSMKRINIYEPIQRKSQENEQDTKDRKVVGSMIVQITNTNTDDDGTKDSLKQDQIAETSDVDEEIADGSILTGNKK
ncbi:hypothetical protein M9Y10_015305 [Tritrichomonas musculus]|uniref:Nucleoplasmin-like domain-containing protein n=1 Tax=Tritrichomonas musculus TaxID=1915356 RepID=A0ABR2L302_9EUKA